MSIGMQPVQAAHPISDGTPDKTRPSDLMQFIYSLGLARFYWWRLFPDFGLSGSKVPLILQPESNPALLAVAASTVQGISG